VILRRYQTEAVEAVYRHLREYETNPCVVCPTGAGKSLIIAQIARDVVELWNGRILILAHVKELLDQAVDKLVAVAPGLWHCIGVYSAGLGSRDTDHPIIVGGIQSVFRRARDLGRFDLILIDEAHLIPPDGEGMYRQFLDDARAVNPNVRVIGLTATPFRMKSGSICSPENILNEICYEIGVRELIVQGFLCPLRTKAGAERVDFGGLHVRGGEFVAGEVEDLMDEEHLVHAACAEIVEQTTDRRSVLIFASGVKHGEHIVRRLNEAHGFECGFVTGDTESGERDRLLDRFRAGDLKYLCNVNVLTTGFDAPNVDCVALVRPTKSPGLYYQMVGRGFRVHPGKTDCVVLDFGGNVLRHGPVDQIRISDPNTAGNGEAPAKECPACRALIHAAYSICPDCGFAFPPAETRHLETQASSDGILSDQITRTEYEVGEISYHVHFKRNDPSAAPTMRVDYRCGLATSFSEWVCLEHTGYARQKAEQWWRRRSNEPVPDDVDDAVDLARSGALTPTLAITIERKPGEKYDRIVSHVLGPRPPRIDTDEGAAKYAGISEDQVPF